MGCLGSKVCRNLAHSARRVRACCRTQPVMLPTAFCSFDLCEKFTFEIYLVVTLMSWLPLQPEAPERPSQYGKGKRSSDQKGERDSNSGDGRFDTAFTDYRTTSSTNDYRTTRTTTDSIQSISEELCPAHTVLAISRDSIRRRVHRGSQCFNVLNTGIISLVTGRISPGQHRSVEL